MNGHVYLTVSWCYGSKKIFWIQSVLRLLGLLGGVTDLGLLPKFYYFLVLPLTIVSHLKRSRIESRGDCTSLLQDS